MSGLCTGMGLTWIQELEQSVGRRGHAVLDWAQELTLSDQNFDVDGLIDTLYLTRTDKLPVKSWNDPDKLPPGLFFKVRRSV